MKEKKPIRIPMPLRYGINLALILALWGTFAALIGQGAIGTEAIVRVLTHPALRRLPFVLETPTDDAGHGEEIAMLRAAIGE